MNKNYKMYKNIVFASTAVLATTTTMLVNAEYVSADITKQENNTTEINDTNTDTNTVTLNKTSATVPDSDTAKTQKGTNVESSENSDKNIVVTDGETQQVSNEQHEATTTNSEKDDSKKDEATSTEFKESKESHKLSNNVRKETKPVTNSETKRDNNKISSTSEKSVKTANVNDNQSDEIISKWGTSDISFNKTTGVLTVDSGTLRNTSLLDTVDDAGKVNKKDIKKIIFRGHVVASRNSEYLFGLGGLTTMDKRFWDNLNEIEGDLDLSNTTNCEGMFQQAINLKYIDVSKWNTSNVTNMAWMFNATSSLVQLDVSGWNTSKVTNMESMFQNDKKLKRLDTGRWNTSNVTNMAWMFSFTENLEYLDVADWNTSKVASIRGMFRNTFLHTVNVHRWNTIKVTDMAYMFTEAINIKQIDVSNWDTSKVTDMGSMFYGASSLNNLDVSKWDTSKVTSMPYMFSGASNLNSLDVSNWDTSKVTNMAVMFNGASSLTQLNVSRWNTSNVINMGWMFNQVSSLVQLDVSGWDTSKVTTIRAMFQGTLGLHELDMHDWNTSNVTDMAYLFSNSKNLEKIDLSNMDTTNVTNKTNAFNNTNSLRELKLGLKTIFDGTTKLPLNGIYSSDEYTGAWKRIDPKFPEKRYNDSTEFMTKYDGSEPGTYIRELKQKIGKIIVKYEDVDGKKIAADKVLTGDVNTTYQTEKQVIDGYTFKEVQGNATGEYTEADQTITYVYTKDVVPAKQGKITVKYQDTNGKKIATDKLLTGDVDTVYKIEKQNIDGYTFKEIQGNATGKYTEADQTVIYVYTKNAVSIQRGTVTIQYLDTFGHKLSEASVLIGNIGEPIVSSAKEIQGYKLVKVDKSSELFTKDAESVIYIYVKDDSKPNDGSNKPDDDSSKPNSDSGKLSNDLNNFEYNSSELRNTVKHDRQHPNIDTDDSKKTLPNTGSDRSDNITAAGAVLAGMTVVFGMLGKTKRKEQ